MIHTSRDAEAVTCEFKSTLGYLGASITQKYLDSKPQYKMTQLFIRKKMRDARDADIK